MNWHKLKKQKCKHDNFFGWSKMRILKLISGMYIILDIFFNTEIQL